MRLSRLLAAVAFCLIAGAMTAPRMAAAQTQDLEVIQIQLTADEVSDYIAAQQDLERVIVRLPEDRPEMPGAKSRSDVEAILRRHNFDSLDDYNVISRNIALVLEGIDPTTGAYVGADAVLKRQLAELEADPSVSPDEKQAASEELNAAMKATVPVKFPGNIDLVVKNLGAIIAHSPFESTHEN